VGPAARDPDAAPADLGARAELLLRESEDAFAESRERIGIDSPISMTALIRALRRAEHDAVFARETRLRRLAGFFPGFARELGARVRPVSSTFSLGPRPRAIVVRAPEEVRLLLPPLEL